MYEVVEAAGEWIVRRQGAEIARYAAQEAALRAVAEQMRQDRPERGAVSFAMRFQSRA
jgi:hypothetical protein